MKLFACMCNQPQRLQAALAPVRAALVAPPPIGRWGMGYIQGGDVLLVRTPKSSEAPVDLASPLDEIKTDCAIAQAVGDDGSVVIDDLVAVVDGEGNRYLDFFGGILTTMTGYNVPEVVEAIREQADEAAEALRRHEHQRTEPPPLVAGTALEGGDPVERDQRLPDAGLAVEDQRGVGGEIDRVLLIRVEHDHGVAVAGHVEAGHQGGARGRPEQGREHVDGRRLARAIGTEKAEELPLRDRERDAVHGREAVERLHQAFGTYSVQIDAPLCPL